MSDNLSPHNTKHILMLSGDSLRSPKLVVVSGLFFGFRRATCAVNFSPSGNSNVKKEHDDKDDGESPNGDNGKGSREDVNGGL